MEHKVSVDNIDNIDNTYKSRLLILGCSMTKDARVEPLPAAWRYTGAYYQMLHQQPESAWPDIIILSARFGYLSGAALIEAYDHQLDRARAEEFKMDYVHRASLNKLLIRPYSSVFLAAGSLYREVVLSHLSLVAPDLLACLQIAKSGIGQQRGQLKNWLATPNPAC